MTESKTRMSSVQAKELGYLQCTVCHKYQPRDNLLKGERLMRSCVDCRTIYQGKKAVSSSPDGLPTHKKPQTQRIPKFKVAKPETNDETKNNVLSNIICCICKEERDVSYFIRKQDNKLLPACVMCRDEYIKLLQLDKLDL